MGERPKYNPEKRPAPRREPSDHPDESVEQPVNRERAHELARELEIAEREMQGEVHDAMANFLTKLGKSKPARWVSRGVLLATLFTAETAMADVTITYTELPPLAPQTDGKKLLEDSREKSGSSLFQTIVDHGGIVRLTGIESGMYQSFDEKQFRERLRELAEKGRVEFSTSQIYLTVRLDVSSESAVKMIGQSVVDRIPKGDTLTIEGQDKFGNETQLDVFQFGENVLIELMVKSPRRFAQDQATDPTPVLVSFDLSSIGLGAHERLFVVQSVPFVQRIGSYSVYRDGIEKQRADNMLDRFGPLMMQGIERARSLFDGHISEPRIILYGKYGQNASADSTGLISIHADLLEPVSEVPGRQWSAQEPRPGYQIEDVLMHEGIHLADWEWSISDDSRWSALFERTTRKNLSRMSEAWFSRGEDFGGHAQKNQAEFFASFVNSLDHPEWERYAQQLNPSECALYRTTLETLAAILSDRMEDRGLASLPLSDLIQEHIVFFERLEERIAQATTR